MTNPFDLILAPAAVPSKLLFVSDALVPSEGWTLPVAPATKTLFPFQAAAVEAILTHRRVVIGHAPGMGKTAMAQAATAAIVAEGGRVMVVVPPSLRVDPWADEFAADYPHLRVITVEGTKPARIQDADVAIVGDSVIGPREADLLAWGATALFGDEAHRYKSLTAKRAQAFKVIADTVNTVITMTGTLAVNRPNEIYMPLRATGVAGMVSHGTGYNDFKQAWCITETIYVGGGRKVEVVKGCKDAAGLHRKLRETCYVRVEREDVLALPNKGWSVHNLALNGSMATYRRMEQDFVAWVRANRGDKAAQRASKAEAITTMMALWQAAGVAKIGATAEYVAGMVDQGEQVVVMAWHAEVIKGLAAAFAKAKINVGIIKGGLSAQAKADIVRAFQAGETQVLVGQIEAAGVGITLHKAANLVFAQLPWSPGSMQQAADRIYRIGQTRNVTMHVLNAGGSIDERLWRVIQDKAALVDAINAGRPVTIDPESVIEGVLAGYGW